MRPIDLTLLSIFRKADQLHKEPHPPLRPDVRPLAKPRPPPKKKKAQLTAAFNCADVLSLHFFFCHLVILIAAPPAAWLYVESIRTEIHFIRSLQMYVKLDLSLKRIEAVFPSVYSHQCMCVAVPTRAARGCLVAAPLARIATPIPQAHRVAIWTRGLWCNFGPIPPANTLVDLYGTCHVM